MSWFTEGMGARASRGSQAQQQPIDPGGGERLQVRKIDGEAGADPLDISRRGAMIIAMGHALAAWQRVAAMSAWHTGFQTRGL